MVKQRMEILDRSTKAGSTGLTLIDVLRQRAELQPHHCAYTFLDADGVAEAHLTYADVDRQARKIGATLQTLINPGEPVLLLYLPGLDYVTAFLGCLYAGAVAVPANPPKRNRNLLRLQAIIADSRATTALTTDHLLGRMKLPASHESNLSKLRWVCTDRLASDIEDNWRLTDVRDDAPALLQYTSGSTAAPKGVMLSHRNLLYNERLIQAAFQQDQESIIAGWLPPYHDMGLIGNIIQPLFVGGRCVLMSPMTFLQRPVRWLQAISQNRVTTSGGPNFAYELCVRKVTEGQRRTLDLSCWKVAFNGSEPIRRDTIDRFAEAFEPYGFRREAFHPCYGLAEATLLVSCRSATGPIIVKTVQARALENHLVVESPLVNNQQPAAESHKSIVSCGVVSEQRVVIVDPESFIECLPEQVGEVWVSGESIAQGYWNRPEETTRTFQAYVSGSGEGPFLRTGDLGFLQDGQLFITGRLKDLIIIRGLNYYPQDIEQTVEQCHTALRPGCGAAISFHSEGEERLGVIQEIDPSTGLDLDNILAKIIEIIAETHDIQPHAIELIRPGSLPKTSSGKIQRLASRAAFLEGSLRVLASWRAPSIPASEIKPLAATGTEMETAAISSWLQSLVAEKLGLPTHKIDVNDVLVRYGLDSLTATELIHGIEESLGIRLPLSVLLDNFSITELAVEIRNQHAVAGGFPAKAVSERPADPITEYPLSRGQRALWFIQQLSPETTAYNIASVARIKPALNVAALKKAFQILLDRHPCLRTVFVSREGLPVQRVLHDVPVSFHQEDATDWSELLLSNYLVEQSHTSFDLSNGPLMRVILLNRSGGDHLLMFVIHHLVADFWSLTVMVDELAISYQSEVEGPPAQLSPPPLDYAEFVRWQEQMLTSDEGKRLEAYWRGQLSGELPMLNLPLDRPRPPAQTYTGASHSLRLNANLCHGLRELSQACGATLYMTLLAVFQVLLHRYTGQTDVVLGSPTANRSGSDAARTIGYFVNLLVLRAGFEGNPSFKNCLEKTRQSVLGAFQHQDYPFDLLVETLQPERDPSFSPLFQVMFVFLGSQLPRQQNLASLALGEAGTRIELGGLELESIALPTRTAQFDLILIIAESNDMLSAKFEYNTDLFDSVTIVRLSAHLRNLIESILVDPSQQVSNLSLMTKSETHQLLSDWNDTAADWSDGCMHDLVIAQLRKTPNATALVFNNEVVSCQELDARTNQLAAYLSRLGAGPDTPVGVFVERSPDLLISLLGVLKAGAAYLPLDPTYPQDRLKWMLEDSGAKILITQRDLADRLMAVGTDVICVDADWNEISKESHQGIESGVSGENLAYVIYTSGSSGRPKGVMIPHRAICNRLMWMQSRYPFTKTDRLLQKTPAGFDASVWELFMPLISGVPLVIAAPGGHQDSDYLVRTIREQEITILQLVPTMLQVLLDEPEVERCKSLRLLYSGGEALGVDVREKYFKRIGKGLTNLYGPTETSIDATYFDCKQAGSQRTVPIGRPIANNQAYVLDPYLTSVPIGVAGELFIGGNGLGRGYRDRADLTAERFIPNPFGDKPGARLYRTGDLARHLPDGCIEFLGRLDFQVKIRGFRIELGEIESRLMQHPMIRDAVVVARDYNEPGLSIKRAAREKRLVAYLIASGAAPPAINDLRNYIKEALPDYMAPSAFVFLQCLPLTASGKLDRRALPAPSEARPELAGNFAVPGNLSEEILANIWARTLGLERVGIHDNFFDLGGDSILSIQIVAKARQAGLSLNAKDIFQYQTIAELAKIAGSVPVAQAEQGMITGTVPLTPIQHWFFAQNFANAHHWNQFVLLDLKQPLGTAMLEQALACVIGHHDVLGSQFRKTENGWEQIIRGPQQSAPLVSVDLTETAGHDEAFAIRRCIDEVQTSLSLSNGEMVRAVRFKRKTEADKLLIVIHHLVTDAVSWRIILEDLEKAYNQLSAGQQICLPLKTTSFKQWAENITQYADSGELDEVMKYWLRLESQVSSEVPVDYPEGSNTVASADTISIALSKEETRTLWQEVIPAYRARVDELLLTALLLSFEGWSGEHTLFIDVEGHGREDVVSGVDLSRTVGWFTSIYPLMLQTENRLTPSTALKLVKERMRGIPGKGIGYGLLRYCGRAEVREQMQSWPSAQIIINFLGNLDQSLNESPLFSMSDRAFGLSASPAASRPYLIEIEGSVMEGCLQMKWTYSKNTHRRSTIERATKMFLEAIRRLLEEGGSVEADGLVPSDFMLAKLDQNKLNKLSAVLNKRSNLGAGSK